jgi:hypothetical protein
MTEKEFKTKYQMKKQALIEKGQRPIEPQLTGRPRAIIDWDMVDSLLEAGCSGASIANSIGVDKKTIYERCLTDKGISFSQYSQQKNEKGENRLRVHQYAKALGLTEAGDNTLLIWLGKCRLKQTDAKMTINLEGDHPIAQLINEAAGKSKNLVKDDEDPEST